MAEVIGIDLGGTKIKFGRFTQQGICQENITLATPQPATPKKVLGVLLQGINQIDPKHQTLAIGVGYPGPADKTGKIARIAINLSNWHDVPLANWLETATGIPTILENDANCAGIGEAWLGASKNYQDSILLTLGTGVGGAIILQGKLFTGRHGTAGELGLTTLNPHGPACNSGNQGSLEQYASIRAIRRQTGKEPQKLGELAAAGDETALVFWQEYGKLLGAGLASLIYVLTPEAVIIGGGISASAKFFLPAVKAEIERRVLFTCRHNLQILTAKLGNNAGMVGAAKLAWAIVKLERAIG
ncbi:MAG: ROK family protein [Cyanobacteria bacterium J083]|nr:MAG: ROK family protein [Cyanobacteria bacterium J083]